MRRDSSVLCWGKTASPESENLIQYVHLKDLVAYYGLAKNSRLSNVDNLVNESSKHFGSSFLAREDAVLSLEGQRPPDSEHDKK